MYDSFGVIVDVRQLWRIHVHLQAAFYALERADGRLHLLRIQPVGQGDGEREQRKAEIEDRVVGIGIVADLFPEGPQQRDDHAEGIGRDDDTDGG